MHTNLLVIHIYIYIYTSLDIIPARFEGRFQTFGLEVPVGRLFHPNSSGPSGSAEKPYIVLEAVGWRKQMAIELP